MTLSAEQRAVRMTGIGATDAVAIVGLSPRRKAMQVYAEKVGEIEPEEGGSEAMELGHELEPIALRALARKKGLILSPGETERHPILPWALATPDANVMNDNARVAVAEAKAVGFRMAKYWGDGDELPVYVIAQVTWQMLVTKTKRAHVVALLGTEAKLYEVEYDDDLGSVMLEKVEPFWCHNVAKRIPPDPDASAYTGATLAKMFRRENGAMLAAPVEAELWARKYFDAQREADSNAAAIIEAENNLKLLCGANAGFVGDGWRLTWKKDRTGRVSWKEVAMALDPSDELIEAHTSEPVRRFLCKPSDRK